MQTLVELINRIASPNREKCMALWHDNAERFQVAWGSSHNHQAWPGGYIGHVTEIMNIAVALHATLTGIRPVPFNLPDALLVLYLHDLEKPWRFDPTTGEQIAALKPKAGKAEFRLAKIAEYGIVLTPEQANALKYVEGENDDYSSTHRVMNELAAFCHLCDVTSARVWHDQPK